MRRAHLSTPAISVVTLAALLLAWLTGLGLYYGLELGPDPFIYPELQILIVSWFPVLLAVGLPLVFAEYKWQLLSNHSIESVILLITGVMWAIAVTSTYMMRTEMRWPWLWIGWWPAFATVFLIALNWASAKNGTLRFGRALMRIGLVVEKHFFIVTALAISGSVISVGIGLYYTIQTSDYLSFALGLIFPAITLPMIYFGNHLITFLKGFHLAGGVIKEHEVDRVVGARGNVLVPVHIHPWGAFRRLIDECKTNQVVAGLSGLPFLFAAITGIGIYYWYAYWLLLIWVFTWIPVAYFLLSIWSKSIYGFTQTEIFTVRVEFTATQIKADLARSELRQFKQISIKPASTFGMHYCKIDPGFGQLGQKEAIEGDYVSNYDDFLEALEIKKVQLGVNTHR